jgi:hypothetical protein
MQVGIELAAAGLLTIAAGASDGAANAILVVVAILWIIYMVTDPTVIAGVGRAIQNVSEQAS